LEGERPVERRRPVHPDDGREGGAHGFRPGSPVHRDGAVAEPSR